jgi:hypothetical protein
MTEEFDEDIRLIQEHFEMMRQRDIDRDQAKADAAAAEGDEWRRKFWQESADRSRAFTFAWQTSGGPVATG